MTGVGSWGARSLVMPRSCAVSAVTSLRDTSTISLVPFVSDATNVQSWDLSGFGLALVAVTYASVRVFDAFSK